MYRKSKRFFKKECIIKQEIFQNSHLTIDKVKMDIFFNYFIQIAYFIGEKSNLTLPKGVISKSSTSTRQTLKLNE